MGGPPSKKKKDGESQSRPIRFVSSDGLPQTKRRRINAACLTCRKRKIRCSGEQPVCKTCVDMKHTCLGYTEPDKSQSAETSSGTALPSSKSDNEEKVPAVRSTAATQTASASVPNAKSEDVVKSSNMQVPVTDDTAAKVNQEQEKAYAVESPVSNRSSLGSTHRTHVPYFRYFGPTAIVPGFKQMVVRVRDGRKTNYSQSSGSLPSLRSPQLKDSGSSLAAALGDTGESNTIPFYDRDDGLPPSNLVTHLCELFFENLGCSFPFLQRDRFLADLKEKRLDTMLVDAVCALAARFSPHPLLSSAQAPSIDGSEPQQDTKLSNQGQPFAQRAMSAVVDSLSCPTLSGVQACLLLAYEEFGCYHDSGLWMYLGIAIRMAQDLGMQKLQGLKYRYGRTGLTPKAIISGQAGSLAADDNEVTEEGGDDGTTSSSEEKALERERVDTFWSVFFLDRVISSGTGRPVTLRDEDIELRFPLQSESKLPNGWPAPFPPLIRIIHLYGRVTDLINGIEDNNIDENTLKRLAAMESDLTGIYQRLSPKLHFNAVNFQAYVRAREGTNFILLHFWFHTLIVLLHQPTLLHAFGGRIQQLYPNSRELSMSSAKTIADILSFSELIDIKSFIGNPFTSQPMYIAACAFLMESAYYSSPSSRSGSPPAHGGEQGSVISVPDIEPTNGSERKLTPKHVLLASAAKENYQRCYKALKALETYWEGTRYILTVLDQKAKGVGDPLLYTAEEMESTFNVAPSPAQPGRPPLAKPPPLPSFERQASNKPDEPGLRVPESSSTDAPFPRIDPSHAIGWALTGAINSSQPNLSLLYQMPAPPMEDEPTKDQRQKQTRQGLPTSIQTGAPDSGTPFGHASSSYSPETAASSTPKYPSIAPRVDGSRENMMMTDTYANSGDVAYNDVPAAPVTSPPSISYGMSGGAAQTLTSHPQTYDVPVPHMGTYAGGTMIGSQDVDVNHLQSQGAFPFSFSNEFVPWLEYLPQDVLSYFGDQQQGYATQLTNPDQHDQPGEHETSQ